MVVATFTAVLMIGQQVASKATRDALFLSSFDADWLPRVMIASAFLSMLGVVLMSRVIGRFGPSRVSPGAFLLSGGLFVAEYAFEPAAPFVVAFAVYLHVAGIGSIIISAFWSVINERFDPHRAKASIARIGIGATFGGVLGGLLAERVAVLLDVRSMLLFLAGLNIACGLGIGAVGSDAAAGATASAGGLRSAEDRPPESGLSLLRRTPYLKRLALLIAVVAISSTYLDFSLKASAAEEFGNGAALMQFFALFYTGAAIGGFLLQAALANRALAKLGLAGTMAILPLSTIVLGGLGVFIGRLWIVVVARAAEMLLSNSLFRSGYELFYTPLPQDQKRASKTIIDVGSERLGDAAAGASILLILLLGEAFAIRASLGLAVAGAVAALYLARRLHLDYVDALAASLKSGVVRLDETEALDATTKRTLVDTTMALDREKLLAQIEELRTSRGESRGSPTSSPPSRGASVRPREGSVKSLLRSIERVYSSDLEEVRRALADPVDPAVAIHVLCLLGHSELHREATDALRSVAPRITGQLVDALLDATQPMGVRRRIPRILAVCAPGRASDGLFHALYDPRFEIRFQSGRALSTIRDRHPEHRFDTERVFAAVCSELDAGAREWDKGRIVDEDPGSEWLDGVVRRRLHRGLEHVFTLLGLALDREALAMSLRALDSGDLRLRGTALEYLENVLPETIRQALEPHLGQGPARPRRRRPAEEVIDDLLQSLDSFEIDRSQFSKEPEP